MKQEAPTSKMLCILSGSSSPERIYVCGDYGIFLEAEEDDIIKENIIVQPGQEFRFNDKRYSENIKYFWYTMKKGKPVKIYFQQKEVTYADYKPGKYYFSPYEVTTKV